MFTQKRDSIYQLAQQTSNDSTKIALMNWVVANLLRDYPDSAIVLGKDNLIAAKKSGEQLLEGELYLHLGNAMRRLGDYEEAIQANQNAIAVFEALGDSLWMAKAYQGLGNVYRQTGDYPEALKAQIKTSQIQECNNAPDTDKARTFNQLATIYQAVGEHEKAVDYFEKSLTIWEKKEDPQMIGICYVNLGGQMIQLMRYEAAKEYLINAKMLFDSIQLDYGVSAALANLAEVYRKQGKLEEAKTTVLDALERNRKRGDKGRIAITLFSLGEIETEQNQFQNAILYYQEALALAEQIGRKASIRDANDRLANLYSRIDQFEKAYEHLQAFITAKDSLFNEETATQYQELQTQYETEQKDQEIKWLHEKQILDKRIQYGLIGVCLIFLILASLIYLALRVAKKSNVSLRKEQRNNQRLLQEKEKLLQRLEKTQQQLIRNEKMASIGQLTAGVAHEINNPISFISTNILALKMDYLEIKSLITKINQLEAKEVNEKQIQALIASSKKLDTNYLSVEIDQLISGIERGVKRTRDIVKSLSVFSRNTEEKFQKADLNEGIRSTLMLAKTNISKDIKIETSLGDLPLIACQISPLNQVFMNIISNAAQAIKETGTINIKTWQEDQYVYISISDTGKGMNEKVIKKIFDPFFTTKEVGKGTGLGLSISYGIIEKHQGTIQVKSKEDKGSTFEIKLPIR